MKKNVVIVAGGKGSRMQSDIPKQFMVLAKRPILMHTIAAFHNYDSHTNIVVVLPKDQTEYWSDLIKEYQFNISHTIAIGGNSRYVSVKNGLSKVNEGLVAIHDGARPLITNHIIEESFRIAMKEGNAITSVEMKDSIRRKTDEGNESVNRALYKIVQTPQSFHVSIIKKAFEDTHDSPQFTDDASVLEAIGGKINLSKGSYENIKITSPEDLIIAEAILEHRK